MFRFGVVIAAALVLCLSAGDPARAGCQLQLIGDYHLTMDGNEALVDVEINGRPARLQVDLGAWSTMLTEAGARQLGLSPSPLTGTEMKFYGVGGETSVQVAPVHSFKIGPIEQKDIKLFVNTGGHRLSSLSAGLLGRDILTFADVEFDFAHAEMKLLKPKDCNGDEVVYWAQSYSMEPIWNNNALAPVEIPVTLNGRRLVAEMDTGFDTSAVTANAAAIAGVRPEPETLAGPSYVVGIGRAPVRVSVATFPTVGLGGEVIQNARLQVGALFDAATVPVTGHLLEQQIDDTPRLMLGADFFMSHRVYVAHGEGKVYFTYNGGPVFQVQGAPLKAQLDLRLKDDDAAIALDPANDEAFNDRGDVENDKGEVDKAIADYDQAVALKPGEAGYLDDACWVRAWAGKDLAKALADCDSAVALAFKAPEGAADVLDSRALVHFRLGDLDKAIADDSAALQREPKMASALYVRGLARRRKGDTAGGDADIAAAKAISPAVGDSYAKAGIVP